MVADLPSTLRIRDRLEPCGALGHRCFAERHARLDRLRLRRVAAAIGRIEEAIGDEMRGTGDRAHLAQPDGERGDRPVDAEGEHDFGEAETIEILRQRVAVE